MRSRDPNRVSLVLILAIVSLDFAWVVFSKHAVPPLIAGAYRGESWPLFNKMISGQASHSLSEYLSDWDNFRFRMLLEFSLVGALILAVIRPEFREAFCEPPTDSHKTSSSYYSNYLWIAVALFAAYPLFFLTLVRATHLSIQNFFFEPHDLMVFFNSSDWVIGKGRLYLNVRSEYPILANLIFGFVRLLSSKVNLFGSEFANFSLIWIACAAAAFICLFTALPKRNVRWGSWLLVLLLAPATIGSSLFRYDIYPVVFCFWGLGCIRRQKWNLGALLLGICIAFKGYALILIPALFVFCIFQIGLSAAGFAVCISLLPLLVSNLGVYLWGGQDALLAPYKLQVFRGFNGESSFDSLFFLVSKLGVSPNGVSGLSAWLLEKHIPKILQAGIGSGVCLFGPACFASFMDAAFFSVLGFMTFSSFYSPQYLIWLLPFLLFTDDGILLFLGILLAWSTYLYFPVGYDIRIGHRPFFEVSVLAVTAIRFLMMARLVRRLGTKEAHTPLRDLFASPVGSGRAKS